MIVRVYDKGATLYYFNDTKKECSLGYLVRCHAKDLTDYDFEKVMNFIKDAIDDARTLQRKINLYGLYETLYYNAQQCDMERCALMLQKYQREFMQKIIKDYNIKNY